MFLSHSASRHWDKHLYNKEHVQQAVREKVSTDVHRKNSSDRQRKYPHVVQKPEKLLKFALKEYVLQYRKL